MKNSAYLLLAIVFVSCVELKTKKTTKAKPNIVFIFTDDQTYSAIHALGNTEISTPALDAFVEEGVTFTRAYNMGAWGGAVCAASRTMLNSGRTVWRANQFRKRWRKNDSLAMSWSKLMESVGYETYMTGKWHVDAKADSLFNHVQNVRKGMPKDTWQGYAQKKRANKEELPLPVGYGRPKDAQDQSWSPSDKKFGGFWEGGTHWSEVVRNDAIGYINEAKTKDTPFFMYLAFNAPHDPRQAPQEFVDMYPLENISVPKSFATEYPFRNAIKNGNYLRDEMLAPMPRTAYAIKVHTQEYYASISHLDAQIGMIVEALKESGKMDNTYIIMTSDHGLAMGRHGFMGKQNLYDHSIRPPLLLLGPDIPKNKKVDADVYLQDVMATALELGGVAKPSYVEFNSFLSLAKGARKESHYDAIYGAYLNAQRMIRKDGYKLLVYPEINRVRLYNMNEDPEEMNDLASLPEHKEKIKSLFKDLMALQADLEDTLDLKKVYETL